MEFVTWDLLGNYAGTMAMVGLLTQLTKNIKFISAIPTQLWSYILSLVVMYCAHYFLGQLTTDNAVLILFNAALVSLGSNGGYESIVRAFSNKSKE
jgi:predicted permease